MVLPDTARGNKLVNLDRDLHYILISICQDPTATVVRQNRYTANGCETVRLLNSRFSLPVGTRSVGYLTKLLKPSFSEQQFEEQFLQWEYDLNRYERDNGAALPDGVKIAVLLNETNGALQQHLQLRAGTMTTYTAVRDVVIEYYKTISAFSEVNATTSSAVDRNYACGLAAMDVDNLWKQGNYKGRHKGGYKGHRGKGKGNYKGQGKGTSEWPFKERWSNTGKGNYGHDYSKDNKGKGHKGSCHQGGKSKSKGKGKGNYNNSQGKGTCYKCGRYGHYASERRMAIWQLHEGEPQEDYDHEMDEIYSQDWEDYATTGYADDTGDSWQEPEWDYNQAEQDWWN